MLSPDCAARCTQGVAVLRWFALATCGWLGLSGTPVRAAAPREPVVSIQPLLIAALRHGQAHGVLVGSAAEAIASQFASREPIEIDVTVVADLATPSCKRLLIETRQDQVADRKRATVQGVPGRPLEPKPMSLRYQISYCSNGTFPPSAGRAASAAGLTPVPVEAQ